MKGDGESPSLKHELSRSSHEGSLRQPHRRDSEHNRSEEREEREEKREQSFPWYEEKRKTQEQIKIRARVRCAIHEHACARERIPREIPVDRVKYPGRQITRPGRENRSSGKTGGKDRMLAKSTESSAVIKVH